MVLASHAVPTPRRRKISLQDASIYCAPVSQRECGSVYGAIRPDAKWDGYRKESRGRLIHRIPGHLSSRRNQVR